METSHVLFPPICRCFAIFRKQLSFQYHCRPLGRGFAEWIAGIADRQDAERPERRAMRKSYIEAQEINDSERAKQAV
jgi:hypothetical protein